MINLPLNYLTIIKEILQQFVPNNEVWAFGSRVTGTAKEYSDLDLTIISNQPLDFGVLGDIRDAFSESDLPFKVDVVDWATTSIEFREIIMNGYQVIQTI
jgi:predicted nucleotidyltransferase